MGALFMGNKPLLKPDTRCSFPVEQFLRFLHYCGLPKEDVDFIHCDGPEAQYII
jgi:1-pyrroline-5-carboxylate dehydrogenase